MNDQDKTPVIHGLCDVPRPFTVFGGKTRFAHQVLDRIPVNSEQAMKIECSDHQEAANMRRTLHYTSYIKYGGQGNLRIKVEGNFLYVWLIRDPVINFSEVSEFINSH